MRGSLGGQRRHHLERAVGDPANRVAQPEPKQRGHLVVSRPARAQPAAEVVADPVDQPAFQRPVHVLVGDDRQKTAVGDILTEAVQTGQQAVALLLGQQPRPEQHPACAFDAVTSYGASTQSKWVDLLSAASASDGPSAEPTAPERVRLA